jgi:3-methyladenine DNA glycosylase AlkD
MIDVASAYREILNKVDLYKNGKASESMQKLGLDYGLNYGLAIPDFDKILSTVSKNNSLAEYCWKQDVREAKLLSFSIFDPVSIMPSQLNELIEGINNVELAEQASIRLFSRMENKFEICKQLLESSNSYVLYAALLTINGIVKNTNDSGTEQFEELLGLMLEIKWEDRLFIKRSLSNVLISIGLINKKHKHNILNWIENHQNINQNFAEWLKQEVIYYLNTKN